MKAPQFILTTAGVCGAILMAGMPLSSAQTDKESTGTIPAPDPTPPPKRMTSPLLPVGPNSTAKGNISYSVAGDALNVSGRIEGLEAGKTYQLAIERPDSKPPGAAPSEPAPPAAGKPSEGKPDEGRPAAGPPTAGRPSEPPPAAGKPDGGSRPGAPGAGEGTSVAGGKESKTPGGEQRMKTFGDLGTVTADSAGSANVNKTLRNVELSTGPNGILGSTLVVRLSSGDPDADATPVAAGVIISATAE